MKNALSSIAIIAVLVALGALTLAAMPRGMETTATASAPAANPAAPSMEVARAPEASNTYNVIAMPLDAEQQFLDAGVSFDGAGLAEIVGPGVQQVLEWNPSTNTYLSYIPGFGGDDINLEVGGVYWLELDSTAGDIVSFVGDVPAQGSVSFALVRPASSGCTYNDISIPLDRDDITTPQGLADDIGNVEQVLQWNPQTNTYLEFYPGFGGDDFDIKIGYPYHVCLQPGGATTWP